MRKRALIDGVTLERSLLLGGFVLAIGFYAAFRAITIWKGAQFGGLDVEQISRIVIVSSMALSLGCEIVLSSFFLSMLKLKVRTYQAPFVAM